MTNKVGERFQITIDKSIREKLGVQPGDQAVEWIENGRLAVAFLPRPHHESLLGILKTMTGRTIEPITDWQAVKERAWEARSREIMEVLEADSRRHRDDPADPPVTQG